MADFNIDRLKFKWKGEWSPLTEYTINDIAYFEGKSYVAKSVHSSSSSFYADYGVIPRFTNITVARNTQDTANVFYINGNESPVIDLKIGSTYIFDVSDSSCTGLDFRFSRTIDGTHDDFGTLYSDGVQITGTSGTNGATVTITVKQSAPQLYYFAAQITGYGNNASVASPLWELVHDGVNWKKLWSPELFYNIGDIVKWQGYLYQCINQHTSTADANAGPVADISNWKLIAVTDTWTDTWTISTNYYPGNVSRYNGITYRCIEQHTSTLDSVLGLENDQSKWEVVTRSDNWRTNWQTSVRYIVDDIVKYGASVYRCTEGHTSSATDELGLEDDILKWEIVLSGIEYKFDWQSSVRYKKNDVVKLGAGTWLCITAHTSTVSLRVDIINWVIWVPGAGFEAMWNNTDSYQLGDVVLYGGYTYISLTNNVSSIPSVFGVSQNTGDWELLVTGYKFRDEWDVNEEYRIGDVVRNSGYLYLAVSDSQGNLPNIDDSWQVLVTGRQWRAEWDNSVEYFLGDVVTYAGTSYICVKNHLSTILDSRPDLDILNVSEDFWEVNIQGSLINVLTLPGDIKTFDSTPQRLAIAVVGDSLQATNGIPGWSPMGQIPDVYYVSTNGVDRPTGGRTLASSFRTVKYACEIVSNNTGTRYVIDWDYIVQVITAIATSSGEFDKVAPALISLLTDTIESREYGNVDDGGGITINDAALVQAYGDSTLADGPVKTWIQTYIESKIIANPKIYDQGGVFLSKPTFASIFVKTGVYQEQLPISVPRNTMLNGDELRSTNIQPAAGYETSNMFYVRNACGVRNMTLSGLQGTLEELNGSLETARPTAGAFISLDPGTGPEDESAWITYQSPYIQNITTFGDGCVGLKVDGELHNGGNKSIVANDFTQVISNGIGIWVNQKGKSEIVSVFTYYAYIGYLATKGGKIRSTNGNNSYGTFGSRAEGSNINEVPIFAEIDNRTREAEVDRVYTNGSNILAFSYANAGQDYTSASINITGSNVDALAEFLFDEFRVDSLYQVRLTTTSETDVPGGSRYQFLLNSAQGGDTTSIQLAASDVSGTSQKYVGMRVLIESGNGAGQFGYITSYNETSKVATISRESDDAAGWDHVYPGYLIEADLDNTTRYTIEPRVIIDKPAFSAISADTDLSLPVQDLIFAEGSWTALGSGFSSLTSVDGVEWDTLSHSSSENWKYIAYGDSTFITTSGTDSTNLMTGTLTTRANATFNTSGLAYKAVHSTNNNWLAIETTLAGGSNVQISNSNGSNWIDGGSLSGTGYADIAYGASLYVAVKHNSNQVATTSTGAAWEYYTMPYTADWSEITYGNGRFVAIASDGFSAYSFDGQIWYESELDVPDFQGLSYGQGVFIAINSSTGVVATSKDGKIWVTFDETSTTYSMKSSGEWQHVVYGSTQAVRQWLAIKDNSTDVSIVQTGAQAVARASVTSGRITKLSILDAGSNYITVPFFEIIDPVANEDSTNDVTIELRFGDGVLPQPSFVSRGTGYNTATATVIGDGFADNYQEGRTLFLKNASRAPGPGDNIEIHGIDDLTFRQVSLTGLSGISPNLNLELRISPEISNFYSPEHEAAVTITQEYSQIRLTNHDFLDIGTGGKEVTNYPGLYVFGADIENELQPAKEVTTANGGRVFYTSTDQNGNFRVGELFAVEQSTGIVTINADLVDLGPLNELKLGGISIGGTEIVVREFSIDPNFTANSNNIVPTQRAIAEYIAGRISGGGSDATTNTLVAGQVKITSNNISTTSGLQINVENKVTITGGVDGHYLASLYYTAK